jgi:hypothetical protein
MASRLVPLRRREELQPLKAKVFIYNPPEKVCEKYGTVLIMRYTYIKHKAYFYDTINSGQIA